MGAWEASACCSLPALGLFPGSGPSCTIKPYVCAFPGTHVRTHTAAFPSPSLLQRFLSHLFSYPSPQSHSAPEDAFCIAKG